MMWLKSLELPQIRESENESDSDDEGRLTLAGSGILAPQMKRAKPRQACPRVVKIWGLVGRSGLVPSGRSMHKDVRSDWVGPDCHDDLDA